MRRVRRGGRAAALAAAATWMACGGGDGGTGTQQPLTGTYALSTVDGTPPPVALTGGVALEAQWLLFDSPTEVRRIRNIVTQPMLGQPIESTDTVTFDVERTGDQVLIRTRTSNPLAVSTDTGTISRSGNVDRLNVRTRITPLQVYRTFSYVRQ